MLLVFPFQVISKKCYKIQGNGHSLIKLPEKQENDIIATEVKNINDTTVINVDANHNYGNNNDYDIELINNIDENYIYHRREQISIIYCKCLFCLVYIVPIFVILFMYIVQTETHHKTR